jgi:membrane fusion protein, multidrug efflux system
VGKGDTVTARDIETGAWSGNWWIVERGLNPGDRVVVDGVQKAAPGGTVKPVALPDSAVADTAAGGSP